MEGEAGLSEKNKLHSELHVFSLKGLLNIPQGTVKEAVGYMGSMEDGPDPRCKLGVRDLQLVFTVLRLRESTQGVSIASRGVPGPRLGGVKTRVQVAWRISRPDWPQQMLLAGQGR